MWSRYFSFHKFNVWVRNAYSYTGLKLDCLSFCLTIFQCNILFFYMCLNERNRFPTETDNLKNKRFRQNMKR